MLAELIRFANDKVVDRMKFCLLYLKAGDVVLGMCGAGGSFARLLPDSFAVMIAPGAVRLAGRLRVPLVLIQPLLDGLRCIFGFVGWCVGVLLEDLQFGQRDDITICRLMPDGLLRGAVVVVEAIGLRIEQLPPLRRVGALDGNALKEMKRVNALTNNCDNDRDPLSGVSHVNLDL